jgi:hypothetical protein
MAWNRKSNGLRPRRRKEGVGVARNFDRRLRARWRRRMTLRRPGRHAALRPDNNPSQARAWEPRER